MKELAITAANSITAVGHDGRMTSASVRAGVSRMFTYDEFLDGGDNPITVARIRGIVDDDRDTARRLSVIATMCLEEMLNEYLQHDAHRPSNMELFLGVASKGRPGPRYEDSCNTPLLGIMEKWANQPGLQIIHHGNASIQHAVAQAGRLIECNPGVLCIVGGIDSLLKDSTLNWFERNGRLKSESYGRHQGLIAGEAVSFMVVEDPDRAERANRPVLGRIAGLGLAEEPMPRTSGSPSRNSGLTDACRAALSGVTDRDIGAVFGDLNGENARAREWSMAEMRCFENGPEKRKLWSPANCYGDIGAAGGAVLVNIAAQGFVRGWLPAPVLIFCSDDHGACGALVMAKEPPQDGKTSLPHA